MPSDRERPVLKKRNPKLGRPRRRLPPLAYRVFRFQQRTGWCKSKIYDEIKAGRLRAFRPKANGPLEIPTSELVRLGFCHSIYELIEE
jgi:hypothetical protein